VDSILIVDADLEFADLIRDGLRRRGYLAESVASAVAAIDRVVVQPFDVVVVHLHLAVTSGFDLCAELRDRHADVLAIAITSRGDLDTAVAAIRTGACDFITKPFEIAALDLAIQRAISHRTLRREVRRLRAATEAARPVETLLGTSPAMHAVTALIRRVADSTATVLITGESGTGKELVARAIHDHSARRDAPFIAINCGAVPPALLESELFGHVRGAFTDARHARRGLFVEALDGTVLLDEIGEMPVDMQVKFLRVLQERVVRPVGGDTEIGFSARVIAATHRDLEADVDEGRFREDLFYRINVVQIAVPPLRTRPSDILVLARHFITRIAARTGQPVAKITDAAARLLVAYDWPGNVRELENCIERAMVLASLDELTVDELPEKIRDHRVPVAVPMTADPAEMITLAELERRYIADVMRAVRNNRTWAARVLGIDRRSLFRRLRAGATRD
jgi:DNA-binding NtrC family response regulator